MQIKICLVNIKSNVLYYILDHKYIKYLYRASEKLPYL